MIRLDMVYPTLFDQWKWDYGVIHFLYILLRERQPHVNISHKKMPKFEEHSDFIKSKPYLEHWVIAREQPIGSTEYIGTCYITKQMEIGIQIAVAEQRKGYARAALEQILARYPEQRLLANINPQNAASIALFAGFGFKLLQHTYSLERN